MSDWTGGYVADIDYTYGYYTELNPLRLRLAFLNAGLVPPEVGVACELGFGQGMSVNLHAAASVTHWHGTDFNPSQASFAQELTKVAGSGTQLFDEAFEQFCNRADLPEFDYIGLHGIWSWISDENRSVIVDFLRRKLKVGGVLYISYNTQPGWAAMTPMRDLLTFMRDVVAVLLLDLADAGGDIRVGAGIGRVGGEQLFDKGDGAVDAVDNAGAIRAQHLLARENGHKQPADWAQFVWDLLARQGRRLLKEGKTLDTAEENVAELTAQAIAFSKDRLPILKALQVA